MEGCRGSWWSLRVGSKTRLLRPELESYETDLLSMFTCPLVSVPLCENASFSLFQADSFCVSQHVGDDSHPTSPSHTSLSVPAFNEDLESLDTKSIFVGKWTDGLVEIRFPHWVWWTQGLGQYGGQISKKEVRESSLKGGPWDGVNNEFPLWDKWLLPSGYGRVEARNYSINKEKKSVAWKVIKNNTHIP